MKKRIRKLTVSALVDEASSRNPKFRPKKIGQMKRTDLIHTH